jgi:hypothetical protein
LSRVEKSSEECRLKPQRTVKGYKGRDLSLWTPQTLVGGVKSGWSWSGNPEGNNLLNSYSHSS